MERKCRFLVLFFIAAIFTACSDDDKITMVDPTGSLLVRDQTIVLGKVTIAEVEVGQDSWVVIYADNSGEPGTEILGYTLIEAGNHQNVEVQLDNYENVEAGDVLWASLYSDGDKDGTFDLNENQGSDIPIKRGALNISDSFTIQMGNSITAEDQSIENHSITVKHISLESTGYVAIYTDVDGEPGEVIGGLYHLINVGSHNNVKIPLDENADVNTGDVFWLVVILTDGFFETPAIGRDGNPVKTSITII